MIMLPFLLKNKTKNKIIVLSSVIFCLILLFSTTLVSFSAYNDNNISALDDNNIDTESVTNDALIVGEHLFAIHGYLEDRVIIIVPLNILRNALS